MDDDKPVEHPDPNRWWKNRLWGMKTGVKWAIAQTFIWVAVGFHDAEIIEKMATPIAWSYGTSMILILGYYGNTAVTEFAKKKIT